MSEHIITDGNNSVNIIINKYYVLIEVHNTEENKCRRQVKINVGDDFNGGSDCTIRFTSKEKDENYKWKFKEIGLHD